MILAIDPGNEQSGYVVFDGERVVRCGVVRNMDMFEVMQQEYSRCELAIEMAESFGMKVWSQVFTTVLWTGRFVQEWESHTAFRPTRYVTRRQVKQHICGSARARDPDIKRELMNQFGEKGTKANPGKLFGIKSHAWAALAVAVVANETTAQLNGATVRCLRSASSA